MGKPTPGSACVSNGKFQCVDPTSALLCQSGKTVAMPCRGPNGCQGLGAASTCDDDLAMEGDACQQTLNENYACQVDHTKELICKDGKFAVARTCKGPKKCSVALNEINCDDSQADIGDTCVAEPGDANYACSTDKKFEVVCEAASSKFVVSNTCRGSKGCWITDNTVHCDQTMAREGDQCRPVDNFSCSEDAKQELKCTAQFKWVKHRDCKHDGCKIKGSDVYCD
ncbi:MAG TPA: hypothetical protein VIF15_03610 [Polyangiaceae bacterium]